MVADPVAPALPAGNRILESTGLPLRKARLLVSFKELCEVADTAMRRNISTTYPPHGARNCGSPLPCPVSVHALPSGRCSGFPSNRQMLYAGVGILKIQLVQCEPHKSYRMLTGNQRISASRRAKLTLLQEMLTERKEHQNSVIAFRETS